MRLNEQQLNEQQHLEVIDRMPLVSIDLVLRDSKNRIYLGRRVNEPARDKWFVPGRRILKDESLDDAFEKTCVKEIDERHSRSEARLIGVFTHKYDTNVYSAKGISTHYVVLAYELHVADDFQVRTKDQHTVYQWFSREEADPAVSENADPDVHEYVVEYFGVPSMMDKSQYQILNARRDSFNTLLWQTPVLGLTAQAFLFTIVLSGNVSMGGRTIAAGLAAISALISLQLLGKHRYMEKKHAKILQAYEEIHKSYAANRKIRAQTWPVSLSSYRLWRGLLLWFFAAAIGSLIAGWFGWFCVGSDC